MPKQNTHQNGASKLSEGKSLSADQSSANNNSANSVKTDLAVSVTEEEVIQAADAVRTIRFDDQELKSSQTIPSDQVSKTKSKDHSKKPSSSSHQYYHQGSSSSSGRKHHASPSAPAQKVKQMSQAVGGRHTGIGVVQGAASDIVRSGHLELDTLYASNESTAGRQAITVNVVNAPNNSTLQCGCENINCPFCNLMLSIEGTDPTVLQ